ncbi:hypothetical protein O6H91_01G107000 [Diphasiastrum complanatum]|uniref:Uncharacterized protein n=1 Tax=Diphasiastrum complanatum TaxID=34168 RepID=A0ACC2EUF4_DIPCM|nr:hypothetical protein O6H91_01G107000 [Diphasiastrum complanatum]
MDSALCCQTLALSASLLSPHHRHQPYPHHHSPLLNNRQHTAWLFRCSQLSRAVVNLRLAHSSHFLGMHSFPGILTPHGPHRRSQSTISMMVLPTANPERITEKPQPKWSARAIKAFSMAELEARKMKYPTTGTEALLMGILTEGTSQAARFLRSNGITLFKVRDETIKVLGKADMYFFSPEHPPLTEPAQKALDWAVTEKQRLGDTGEISATLLLLGIWAQKGFAGQQVLASLGFDEMKAKEVAELDRKLAC